MVCRQAVELLTDYLEGALMGRDRARLEAHLADCEHCTAYLDQFRTTIAALGQVEPEALAPETQDELVRLYRRWREG
jgi:predicted anti-sigma-YlaC factor YlaD